MSQRKGESKDLKQSKQEKNEIVIRNDFTNPQGSQNLPSFSGYAIEKGTGTQRTPSMGLKDTPRVFNRES